MSSKLDHVSFQNVPSTMTDGVLTPDPKRRRLNCTQQDGSTYTNRYDSIVLNDSSRAVMGDIYETHNHFNSPSSPSEQEKLKCLRDSLAFKRMDARLHNVKVALKNTCEWLFRHRKFKEWIDDTKLPEHKGFLWLKGKPGCGKSTLMKGAHQWAKAKAKKKWIILSYFFNARAPGVLEKSPLGLYRSLVHEILRADPKSVGIFNEMFSWKDPSDDVAWTIEELQSFLLAFIESDGRPPVVIFVDALDEGDESDIRALISFLEDLTTHSHESLPLRICLSSRHYPHITIRAGLSLIVEQQAEHDRDIEKYVRDKLQVADDASPEISGLHATICEKSASIFLWVVLVVPILNQIHDQGKNVADMAAYLKRLPKDLEGLFAEILSRSTEELRSCVSLLQWVLYSNAPLSSAELYLATEHSWHRPDEDVIKVPNQDVLVKYMLHHSRGLVEVTKSEPPVVQFIHETVREFLAGDHGLAQVDPVLAGNLPGWTHAKLAQACLSYICWNCSQSILSTYLEQLEKLKKKAERGAKIKEWIPFLSYATMNLLLHAEAAEQHGISQDTLLSILQMANGQLDANFLCAYNFCEEHQVRRYKPNVTILYVVSEKGLPGLTSSILTSETSTVNNSCGRYGNALQAACHFGNKEIVQSLLEAGADANAVGGERKTAFGAVVSARHFHLFELLKMYGLRKQSAIPNGSFDWLSRPNSRPNIQELIRTGTVSYLFKDILNKCLIVGTKLLDIEFMETALQNGANVDCMTATSLYRTPLLIAIEKGSVEAAELLLCRDADVNLHQKFDFPLAAAAKAGHEPIVRLLIDRGANLQSCVKYYSCPLEGAMEDSFHQMVQILSDRGEIQKSDSHKPNDYDAALVLASRVSDEKAVGLLLDRGANVNIVEESVGEMCSPALISASYTGCKEIVQTLLDKGANVNTASGLHPKFNALYAASAKGHSQVVQVLLDGGADVNALSEAFYGTALCAASGNGHEKVVQILLDNGADVNALTEAFYGTVLYTASGNGHEKVVQILLDNGADVNAKGAHGSAKAYASIRGHKQVVQMLVTAGARH